MMAQPIELPDDEMTHVEIYILLGGGAHEKIIVALDDLDPRMPSPELNEDIFHKGTLYVRAQDIKNIPEGYLAVRLLLRMCVLSTPIEDIPLECWDEKKPHVQDNKTAFEMAELFRDSYPNYPLLDQVRFIRAGGYNYGPGGLSNANLKHFQEIAPRFAPGKTVLGIIHLNGYGVPVDIQCGLSLLNEAWKSGLTKAGRLIGMNHLQNNLPFAVKCLKLASNRDDRTAKYELANHYNLTKDKSCVKLFEELLTEVKGKMLSYVTHQLATIYIDGILAPHDTARGMRLMEQASNLGCGSASYYIAMAIYEGRLWPLSVVQALGYLQKASDNNIIAADYELGLRYFYGRGTQMDTIRGLELIRKAANGGNGAALRFMAMFYLQKMEPQADYGRAVVLLQNLARGNDKEGIFQLAILHAQGRGVPQNLYLAQEMLQKLVQQGFTAATYTLQAIGSHIALGSQTALGNPLWVTQEIFPPAQAPTTNPSPAQQQSQKSAQETTAMMAEQSKLAQQQAKIIHDRIADAQAKSLQRVVHESGGKRTADSQDAPAMKSGSPKRQIVEVDE